MENLLHDISWVVPLRTPFLTPIFQGFTWLGYLPFFMIFLSLGYWLWDKEKITRLAVLIILSAVVNSFLKDYWQDARPSIDLRLDGGVGESYGLPSGHAQVAAVMWFWLAWEIKKTWAWITATVLVSGVAFSRIYLGVHDVEDVVVGLAIGFASLFIFSWLVSDRFRTWHNLNPVLQVAIILAFLPAFIYLWPNNESATPGISLGLFLAGWWAGANLDRRSIGFQRHPQWWRAALAAVLGIAGLFMLFSGVGKAADAVGLGAYASYITTLFLALYMTLVAPFAFRLVRIGK
ncbi:MAG: hypothetical protein COA62_03085 [Rhodobiaceae bacterium]|nr:MAG: hypothetical protein COA62_03085 [Rhodobiaceae bacterium]